MIGCALTISKGAVCGTSVKTATVRRLSPINRCAAITGQRSAAAGCADITNLGWCATVDKYLYAAIITSVIAIAAFWWMIR
jgi:hypothetical protein